MRTLGLGEPRVHGFCTFGVQIPSDRERIPLHADGAVDLARDKGAMKVPNADRAIIATDKLTDYLLNVSHKRGGSKAKLLLRVGYRSDDPDSLESDLRAQHLSLDVARTHGNAYGVVYEIDGPIKTPGNRSVRFCSVWQVDTGTDVPRFITMYPR
jgi:hypothetical protein